MNCTLNTLKIMYRFLIYCEVYLELCLYFGFTVQNWVLEGNTLKIPWNSHLFLSLVGSLFLSVALCPLYIIIILSISEFIFWVYLDFGWASWWAPFVCEYAWKRKREIIDRLVVWWSQSSKSVILPILVYENVCEVKT